MPVTLEKDIAILRANQEMLRERGVVHAAIFGSVARGDARPDSDVDILIEVDAVKRIGLFTYAGVCEDIREMFPSSVDVVNTRTVKPRLRDAILGEAVYAF